jgi:hypothetical protein
MAINRDGYASLIESVQEAVSTSTAGTATDGSGTSGIQWGHSSIGGAMNAMQLAQWLASQMGGGKPSPNAFTTAAKSGGRGNFASSNRTSVKGGKGSSSAKASVGTAAKRGAITEADIEEALAILDEASWNTGEFSGMKSGYDIAKALNAGKTFSGSNTLGKGPKGGRKTNLGSGRPTGSSATYGTTGTNATRQEVAEAGAEYWNQGRFSGMKSGYDLARALGSGTFGSGGTTTSKAPKSRKTNLGSGRPTGSSATYGTTGTSATRQEVAEEEDFDILDAILAEGIELYGEEGLAEILADFAETGEVSDELALLLSDE